MVEHGSGSGLRIAIFQPDAAAPSSERCARRLNDALAQCAARGADLMVCPELYVSGYNVGAQTIRDLAEPADGPAFEAASRLCRQHGVGLVYGYAEREGDRIYNAARAVAKSGEPLANHRKLMFPSAFERDLFSKGTETTSFTLSEWRLSVLICYDVEFPENVRDAALQGADIVVAPTALKAEWAFVARSMLPVRAFENGIYTVYANHCGEEGDWRYLGGSRIDGPEGRCRAVAGAGEEIVFADLDRASIEQARTRLPYVADAQHRYAQNACIPKRIG